MAKYVLLEFDDDNEADEFVRVVPGLYHIDAHSLQSFKIVGEFKKPTSFCQCTPEQKRGVFGARGSKFGWFVCGRCKKPVEGGNQVIYNLLENDGRPTWKREINLQVLARY